MEFKKKTIIWEDNNEPPKDFIWVKSDENAYEFNYITRKWEKIMSSNGNDSEEDGNSENPDNQSLNINEIIAQLTERGMAETTLEPAPMSIIGQQLIGMSQFAQPIEVYGDSETAVAAMVFIDPSTATQSEEISPEDLVNLKYAVIYFSQDDLDKFEEQFSWQIKYYFDGDKFSRIGNVYLSNRICVDTKYPEKLYQNLSQEQDVALGNIRTVFNNTFINSTIESSLRASGYDIQVLLDDKRGILVLSKDSENKTYYTPIVYQDVS